MQRFSTRLPDDIEAAALDKSTWNGPVPSTGGGMSIAASLFDDVPDCVKSPPVECVVFAWGANEDGQLGCDAEDCVSKPRVIESLLGCKLRGRELGRNPLVAGSRNTMAVSQDGLVWSWGWNDRGTLGRGYKSDGKDNCATISLRNIPIVQAAIGGWHCLAVDGHGKVYAWGGNEYMQCALEMTARDILTPTPIVPHLTVQQVACGGMHSLALTKDGNVWTWGEPWGDFSMTQERTPNCVRKTKDTIMIACGAFHSLALDRCGQVYAWGINDYGQLGNGGTKYCTRPTRVVDLEDVHIVEIAAGGWHSVAVSEDGDLYVWGRGEYGRLGLGDTTGSSRLRPQKVPGLENHHIVQASAGGTHTLCLTSEGIVFIWGRGSFGRLGEKESTRDRYLPRMLELPGGIQRWRVLAISSGGRHSVCLALPTLNEISGPMSTDGSRGDDEGSEEGSQSDPGALPTAETQPPPTPTHEPTSHGDRFVSAFANESWGVDEEDDD